MAFGLLLDGRRNTLKGSETEKAPKVKKTKAKSNTQNHAGRKNILMQ